VQFLEQQTHGEEIAVLQPFRHFHHAVRSARRHHAHQVLYRHGGEKEVACDLLGLAGTDILQRNRRDLAVRHVDTAHARLHAHLATALLHLLGNRLPHLSGTELGVEEPRNKTGFTLGLRLLEIAAEQIFYGVFQRTLQ
jgi:hypothetical protein